MDFKPCVGGKILRIFSPFSQHSAKQYFMKTWTLSLILSLGLLGRLAAAAPALSYDSEIRSALRHLERSQIQERGAYDPGQWPTTVTSLRLPALVGVGRWGKPYEEATVFTTASIVDILKSMYREAPELEVIPALVARAEAGFAPYHVGPFFNFYPLRKRNGVWVRGPRRFKIPRFFLGLAHIPPDADTTSVTYMALRAPLPEPVIEAFSRFRDVDRRPHFYNRDAGNINTGAFLTWLMDETDPRMPRRYWSPEAGARVPFGRNDVDCIVNANVLKLLTYHQLTQVPGYQDSCRLLETAIRKEDYGYCGIYYPTDYLLALRVGELKELGAVCLRAQEPEVLRYLLRTQARDGSWSNVRPNDPDPIQSTALAVNALMLLGDKENPAHRQSVSRGVRYLLTHSTRDAKGNLYWHGQVYFSAIALARHTVLWRSTSYTTALAAQALLRAQNFLRPAQP